MRIFAEFVNAIGRSFEHYGHRKTAAAIYSVATRLVPTWSVPWFNRGLMAKLGHQWKESLEFNLRATELDPKNEPAWWNLGIAATALDDWATARRAWTGYGIEVPSGEGPLGMNLGAVPIRVDPNGRPEVVWCERLDPARARIANIPLAECGRACGDILLTDGALRGYREFRGKQVPVFDEIEVLTASTLSTFSVSLNAPDKEAMRSLAELAEKGTIAMEDWSASVHTLCRKCSEGVPHSHDMEPEATEWNPARSIGLAATSSEQVEDFLEEWLSADSARSATAVECVLRR